MEKKNIVSNIESFKKHSVFSRIVSSVVDAACFAISSFLLLSALSFTFAKSDTPLSRANNTQISQIQSSNLAKYDDERGYLLYELDELYEPVEGSYRIINIIEYYYSSYLTGENLKDGYDASLNYNVKLDNNMLPKEQYDISYINEHYFLSESVESYFTYVNSNKNVPVTFKNEYIIPDTCADCPKSILRSGAMDEFVKKLYDDAVNHFYAQDFMIEASKTISLYNKIIVLSSFITGALIFYIIIPITNKYGITLGKRLMNLILVTDRGFLLKKYQILLRFIPLLAVIIAIGLVDNIYLQLIVGGVIFFASITLMTFTKNKQALHDFIARTVVVNRSDAIIYNDEKHYLAVQSVINEVKNNE